eukprot:3760631-Amphidinium_carterae.1
MTCDAGSASDWKMCFESALVWGGAFVGSVLIDPSSQTVSAQHGWKVLMMWQLIFTAVFRDSLQIVTH